MSSIFKIVSKVQAIAALGIMTWVLSQPSPVAAQTETVEYYATDAIGSVRVVFDAAGNVLGRMDYAPFGEELYTGLFLPSERFAQLTRDGEAGQDYAQARMYQPRSGRLTSPDPIMAGGFDPERWNRYSYALNRPTSYGDPDGLWPTHQISQRDWEAFEQRALDHYAGGRNGPWPYSFEIILRGEFDFQRGRGRGNRGRGNDGGNEETPPGPQCDPITGAGCSPSVVVVAIENFGQGAVDTVKALFSSEGPESCLKLFARESVMNVFPLTPSAATLAAPAAEFAAAVEYNKALAYAASRPNYLGGQGLMYPFKSSVFRATVARSHWILSRAPVLAEGLAFSQALLTEWDAWKAGECR